MTENSEKLNNQAIEFASRGEYDEAIACFIRSLSLENQNYLVWYNLGLTYRDAGDLDAALSAIEKALCLCPDDEEVIEAAATISFAKGEMLDALQLSVLGLNVNSLNSHFWNMIGVVYFNQKDYGSAAEAFEQAITLNPYYADAVYNLRDTYEELGNKIGAQECELKLREISDR